MGSSSARLYSPFDAIHLSVSLLRRCPSVGIPFGETFLALLAENVRGV